MASLYSLYDSAERQSIPKRTELWLRMDGSIQSLPYFQKIDRQSGEAWHSFVARASAETLAYLRGSTPKVIEKGDVYVNVTWVSEGEFRNLRA